MAGGCEFLRTESPERRFLQVTTCMVARSRPDVLQAGSQLADPGGIGTFRRLRDYDGVSTTNLTWSTAPQLGGAIRTEFVLSGTNATTEAGDCTRWTRTDRRSAWATRSRSSRNEEAPWQYSNGLARCLGRHQRPLIPPVSARSSRPVARDALPGVLTALTLTSPVARNTKGMPARRSIDHAATSGRGHHRDGCHHSTA